MTQLEKLKQKLMDAIKVKSYLMGSEARIQGKQVAPFFNQEYLSFIFEENSELSTKEKCSAMDYYAKGWEDQHHNITKFNFNQEA